MPTPASRVLMEDPQDIPVESTVEAKLSEEERARKRIERIRDLLEEGEAVSATALFVDLHPADQGEVLVALSSEPRAVLLGALTPGSTAEVLEHLEPDEAAQVVEELRGSELSTILDEASPDVAADVLKQMPLEQSEEVLGTMAESEDVISLLRYPDETAGGLMTTDFPSVREDITAANALDLLRIRGSIVEDMGALFIVNSDGMLTGSLSVTRLALARPSTIISDVMEQEVISVPVGADQEECARLMERYNLNYLPVVHGDQRLVGLILVEDVVDVLQEEATEDMYRMTGMGGERLFGPLKNSLTRRLPWLYINLATTILAALVISAFESTIAQLVTLAVFLPVVAGQGGIGGTQTLTLVVRSLALGEIFGDRGKRILIRELYLGLINGLLLGIVVGLVAWLWKDNPMLGLILGIAMTGNMLIAGLTGAAVPLLMRRFGMDPAVASAVFVTTITDVAGFLMFLGLAAALIGALL
jgi:magnesium transporter